MLFTVRKRRQPPTIIMISLIDVLIVLLIFLMVTTTFKQQPALKLALPESKQTVKPGAMENNVVITIAKEAPYLYLGKRALTLKRLEKEFNASATKNPQVTVAIRADTAAPVGQLVKVMDAAKSAGIKAAVSMFTKAAGQP